MFEYACRKSTLTMDLSTQKTWHVYSPLAEMIRLSQLSECQCLFVSVFVTEDQIPHGFPTIDMGPQLKVVERTRTATMLCAASGNPDPEIYWFKDFLPVDIGSSNGRIKQLRSGKALISTCSRLSVQLSDC